jgi:VWFA-related protein
MARLLFTLLAFLTLTNPGTSEPRNPGTSEPRNPGTQTQQPPVFRGGVTLVNVDVYPRRDGRVVEGLKAEDFQVFEDGKPQAVEAFEFIRIQPNAVDADRRDPNSKEEGDRAAADPHNRVFVIYLDVFHTSFAGARDTRVPLLDFLHRTIGPTDLFAVTTPDTPPRQLVFGRNTTTLEGELSKHADWGLRDRFISPVGRPAEEAQLETCMTASAMSLGDALVALYREDAMATHLEELVTRLGVLRDGRKNVLLFSEGWMPMPQQSELMSLASGTVPPVGVGPGGRLGMNPSRDLQNKSWCDQQLARLSSIDFDRRFKDLLDRANRANVSFYPIDVGGLGGAVTLAGPRCPQLPTPQEALACGVIRKAFQPSTTTLRILADNTDGRAIFNTNDLGAGVRRIADDLSAYYLLGYASTNTADDGKYRRIEVKVNRPGTSVAARRGYLAPSPAARATAAAAAAAIAVPTAIADELGRLSRLRADAELFGYAARRPLTGSGPAALDIVAEISAQSMAGGKWAQGGEARVSITRASGEPIAATARIEPGARGTLINLPVPDGAVLQRATLTVTGAAGAIDVPFEIPGPAASTLVADPICFRGTPAPRVPLRPVADFQFRRTERLHVEWPILTPLDQRTARVLDRRGQPLPLNATIAQTPTAVTVDLLLAPLAEGDYLIELVAGAGAQTERRLLAFRVVR